MDGVAQIIARLNSGAMPAALTEAQSAAEAIRSRLGSAQQFASALAAAGSGTTGLAGLTALGGGVGGRMGGTSTDADASTADAVAASSSVAASGSASTSVAVTGLSAEQSANAAIIVQVGRKLGVSDKGIQIALATAMQESGLRNLNHGDRDSVGLFQQRPSAGWGTVAQLTDPTTAATKFYLGAKEDGSGGLLHVKGWESMSVTQAAQAVQRSAYPNAYAKWADSAASWLSQLS